MNAPATPTTVTPDLIRGKASFCNDCGTEADCDNATELCFNCFTQTFPQSGEADFQP